MRVVVIVAEYNPFHYGHLYQIRKVKEMYPDSIIIAIISTNYTQRGGFSLINKWDKTRICLNYGIDMVVELPTLYTTQGADMFAYGAISILNMLHIDTLVFGMECDDVEYLIKAAKTQINNSKYDSNRIQNRISFSFKNFRIILRCYSSKIIFIIRITFKSLFQFRKLHRMNKM